MAKQHSCATAGVDVDTILHMCEHCSMNFIEWTIEKEIIAPLIQIKTCTYTQRKTVSVFPNECSIRNRKQKKQFRFRFSSFSLSFCQI